MVTAIVLIEAERERINDVGAELAGMKGIAEVYSVGGRYDLVAVIRVRENEALADVVTNHMLRVSGITRTETMLAFRTYSRHDLDRMFAIGLDE